MQFLKRFDDLEAIAVDVLVEAVVVDGVAEVEGGLGIAAADEEVGILDAQARVVPDAGQRHEAALAIENVEVRPIVEVPIRGGRCGDR